MALTQESKRAVIVKEAAIKVDDIISRIREADPRFNVFTQIDCEGGFRERLPGFKQNPPDLYVIGMMVRWGVRGAETSLYPPLEVVGEDMWYAGRRIERLIHAEPELRQTPVIIYTVLPHRGGDFRKIYPGGSGEGNLPANTYWVGHNDNSSQESLRKILFSLV